MALSQIQCVFSIPSLSMLLLLCVGRVLVSSVPRFAFFIVLTDKMATGGMLNQFDTVTPSPAVTPWKMINARLDTKSPSAYNWRVNPRACRCRNARLLICKTPQDERWDEILMIFLFKNWVIAAVSVRFRTLGKHQREDKYTGFRWLPASLREIFLSDRFTQVPDVCLLPPAWISLISLLLRHCEWTE